jgi:hypothetical protein
MDNLRSSRAEIYAGAGRGEQVRFLCLHWSLGLWGGRLAKRVGTVASALLSKVHERAAFLSSSLSACTSDAGASLTMK